MTIAGKTQRTRHLGRIVAVGTVALLLSGSMATTTEARRAHPANGEIQMCMETGGDPYLFEYWGAWAVGCAYTTVTTGTSDDVAAEQVTATGDRGTSATHARHHQQHQHPTDKHDRNYR